MEVRDKIVIIDDLVSNFNLLDDYFRYYTKSLKLHINAISEEAEIIKKLEKHYSNEELIILVNICFKWHLDVKRTEFAGIKRIIKEYLRINLLRRNPVIAYGTLPGYDFLNSHSAMIFRSNKYHLYFDITKINEIDLNTLIRSVSPIPNENKLREIIIKYCAPELREFLSSSVYHYLEKTYKLDNNFKSEKKEFLRRLKHVERIFPELGKDEMSEIIELLEKGDVSKKEKIKEKLKSVLENIKKKEEELHDVSS